jgi:hypothetical protein
MCGAVRAIFAQLKLALILISIHVPLRFWHLLFKPLLQNKSSSTFGDRHSDLETATIDTETILQLDGRQFTEAEASRGTTPSLIKLLDLRTRGELRECQKQTTRADQTMNC